jgi:hypothetical protein
MKISKLLVTVLVSSLFISPLFANEVAGIDDNDHAALAKHYEKLAHEAEDKLHENQALLEEYEAHPYYFGRQGQDIQSHTLANIHEYEKIVKEDLQLADHHKSMIVKQDTPFNKAGVDLDRSSTQ